MGATVSDYQWNRLKNFLIDMFDDSINDPLNIAFCASDSDDPEIADPPAIVRQLPTSQVLDVEGFELPILRAFDLAHFAPRPAEITNIWA
jgi:hypothetical protein